MSLHYLGKHEPQKFFSVMLHTVSRKQNSLVRNNICTLYLIISCYYLQKIIKIG